MADKGDGGGGRSGRARIKTLAQAALNADVTIEQVDTVLTQLIESLAALDNSIDGLDGSLVTFNNTLSNLDATLGRLEKIVERVEGLMTPWTATEQAVRGAVNAVRRSTGNK